MVVGGWMDGGNHTMISPPINSQVKVLPSSNTGCHGILGKATSDFKNGSFNPFRQEFARPWAMTNGLGISPLPMRKHRYDMAIYMPDSVPRNIKPQK
jgi:hypothetical protein